MSLAWLTTLAVLQCACGTASSTSSSATGTSTAQQSSAQGQQSRRTENASGAAWAQLPAPESMSAEAIDGAWLSDVGDLHLHRETGDDRARVTGRWTSGGGPTGTRGSFVGRLEGNLLQLTWREQRGSHRRAGKGYLVFTSDGQAFYGRWWTAGQLARGEWTGWRRGHATGPARSRHAARTMPGEGKPRTAKRGQIGAGTCFAVSPDGLLVTAAHVINRARSIRVRFPTGNSHHVATVVKKDDEIDLAVLRVARRSPSYLALAKTWPRLGEKVFTIGFPYSFDLGAEPKFSEGVLSSRSVAGVEGLMQVSMPIQPGNSGGPLVNHRGEVVGVVFARADDLKFLERTGSIPQNVAFAVAAGFLRPMIPAPRDRPATISREAAIDRAESAICSVLVEH